jgi:hypothetical protein
MRNLAKCWIGLLIGSLALPLQGLAQGHIDPPYLQIQSAEKPITVDGKLDETDWQRRFDHLVFRQKFQPGDVEYGVTGGAQVSGTYQDTTTTIVKILHYGLDLYISLQSDDRYVNKWGGSWEGDGLFMKVKDATGIDREFKLYFNLSGPNPEMNYEATIPEAGFGVGWKRPGTVVNDTSQIDNGYTAELVIHLDKLGYTDPYADVPVIINIFDPDKQTGTPGEEWVIGSYNKMWWGSEWGTEFRILRLADPPRKIAIRTKEAIVLDGRLSEGFWRNADSIVVAKGSHSSTAGWYMQWGNPNNAYTDQSLAVVKFAHKGTDLYVGVVSNDSSVCEWSPGWEADGLFLWMTYKGIIPGPADRLEIKNMFFGNTVGEGARFELNANVPTGGAEGACYLPPGTLTHTESNGKDAGYSLEVVIHTDMFGYADGDTVRLSVVIWDIDFASADAFNPDVSDYAPHWWGTQWADANFEKYYMYREVVMVPDTTIGQPQIAVSPSALQFGRVPLYEGKTLSFYVINRGDGVLSVTNVTSTDPQFSSDRKSFAVPPKDSVRVRITFKPTRIGDFTAQLRIESNAGPATVTLTGTGIPGGVVQKPGHIDPPYLQIQSAEKPITVDGKLDETDWQRRFDHLVFRQNFRPGDVEYGVTDGVQVSGVYEDTTTTIVKMLHYGLDLYIAIQSNDRYVNKWGGSWEGDGLFMKLWTADGIPKEFKLFWNKPGHDPDIAYEAQVEGAGFGTAVKGPGTVVNDTTQIDNGYTAELVIHLDKLGYTDPYAGVPVILNIFDPDKQTGTPGEEWVIGSYNKMWWGSEWGTEFRILRLADPPRKIAIRTDQPIQLDGRLTEEFWRRADSIVVAVGSPSSTAGWYMQWGNPNNAYTDQSLAVVKFAHKGTDLYVGVVSNDSSVCEWSPGWEADGLFLWMTYKGIIPGPADRLEIKNMFFGNTVGEGARFELNANVPTGGAEGACYLPPGTLTHTESNGKDAGYSLEVVIHTDMFGYADGDTVRLSVVIWDIDFASADAFNPDVSDYAPHWWGTQWADANFEKYYMYREVILSPETSVGVGQPGVTSLPKRFELAQNYPNPFNPTTTIAYQLPKATRVKIEVFDVLGRKVATLFDGPQVAGLHQVTWDGRSENGEAAPSGVYMYRLTTPDYTQIRKMLLVR